MNEFREEIRDNLALEALETCKLEGDVVEYEDVAYSRRLRLWSAPGEETQAYAKEGAIGEEALRRTFFIPRQPEFTDDDRDPEHSFPPNNNRPSEDAIVWYDRKDWAMESFKSDAVNAGFILTCVYHFPRRVEVR